MGKANSPVDYVIIGESEYKICDLVKAIKSGGKMKDVVGIEIFDGKKLRRTKQRPMFKRRNEIPFPVYEKVSQEIK